MENVVRKVVENNKFLTNRMQLILQETVELLKIFSTIITKCDKK